ncbi:MAG: hypothetical protein IJY37_05015 [Clostridia bacterium]|nr:hypothetical protein [Clostridia bacterium]MBP3555480.1 hypothetical protein [Clostridia bacterium]MBQ8419696.1 hypothetical protein [Clostridia bacterium]
MARVQKDKIEPGIFAKRAAAYFRDCDNGMASASCDTCSVDFGDEKCAVCRKKKKRPYTISGLCLAVGITKRDFENFKKNKCFSDAVEMALLKIEAYIEENSISGAINGTLALAILKEHFGWGEKSDLPDTVTVVMSEEAESLAK